MDYAKELADLKEKINLSKSETDFGKTDQYQREIKNELLLKRNQVIQLKKELDAANLKVLELNRSLENNKSVLRETEFNLKLALKKCSSIEDKMKEIDESYLKMKLKEEMRMSEMSILNDNMQKLMRDKHQLSRETDELKDKLKYYSAFQSELEDRQAKINTAITKTREDAERLQTEHLNVIELDKNLHCAEELKHCNELLNKENKKLKNDYFNLENSFIETSAKCDKLTNFIENHKHINVNQQSVIMKINFLQWENRCRQFQQQTTTKEKIIEALTDALNQEMETNAKLILKNEEYEHQIEKLETKLKAGLIKEEALAKIES